DVRILSQHVNESPVEGGGIGQNRLLNHNGVLVVMEELDGVLDGDDLTAALAIDQVHHVVQGGRFAGAGRAGDQHQTIRFARQIVNLRRQAKLFPRRNFSSAKTNA